MRNLKQGSLAKVSIGMVCLSLSGCAGMSQGDVVKAVSTLSGGALGRFAAEAIDPGSQSSKTWGTLAGAAAGFLIGNSIGQYLDEQEQQRASQAANEALDSNQVGAGSTQKWHSPTNVGTSGSTTVTQKMTLADGRVCKTANNFITYKGRDIETSETYCRDKQTGRWILEQGQV